MPIRFKVIDSDREYIDRALADAGLGPTIDAQVRSTLERQGLPAAIGTISGAKVAQRFKAAPANMVSVQMTREEADAWQAAIANEGNRNVVALLRQIAGPGQQVSVGGKLTDSGDQSKPAAKKAYDLQSDPWAIALGADQVKR